VSLRPFPAWMYRYPDSGDTRIPDLQAKVRELEAALLESNDGAAKLRHIALVLIGSNYSLDVEHSEQFLSRWTGDASVRWERP
jgi:hypothetical protein